MSLEEIIGTLAGIFTTAAILPQITKAIKTKDVKGISPFFLLVLITGVGLWTVYGILKNDWPIIITNGVSVLLNTTMLILYFKNKNRSYEN